MSGAREVGGHSSEKINKCINRQLAVDKKSISSIDIFGLAKLKMLQQVVQV